MVKIGTNRYYYDIGSIAWTATACQDYSPELVPAPVDTLEDYNAFRDALDAYGCKESD